LSDPRTPDGFDFKRVLLFNLRTTN
jgi:hypothetical protein